MAGYLYECGQCGSWEIHRPIGTAESTSPCPGCGRPGRRRYTAPLLARTPRNVAAARSREEASADAPAVVSNVPRAVGRPTRRDPRWNNLPRP
jgi:hypothetical protein